MFSGLTRSGKGFKSIIDKIKKKKGIAPIVHRYSYHFGFRKKTGTTCRLGEA
jgi:hypothetical protein